MNLLKTSGLVKSILESKPEARDDDYLLWLLVLQEVCAIERREDFTKHMNVESFLVGTKFSDDPSYETVSRARRKLQARHPHLRASEETRVAREEYEEHYRKYARRTEGV